MEKQRGNLKYDELKASFQIVLEINDYVVLNNRTIYKKIGGGMLKPVKLDDPFIKTIESLINPLPNKTRHYEGDTRDTRD